MMKIKFLMAVLMTLTLIASSAVVVYAGGGAGGGTGAPLVLSCYSIINGASPPFVLNVTDRFGVERIRLGKARLLCTPVSDVEIVNNAQFNPDIQNVVPAQNSCYDVQGLQPRAPGSPIKIIDSFVTETVTLNQLTIFCTPAATDPPLPAP